MAMMSRFAAWLDARIGIESASEQDRALLRERFVALKRQLPWLHGMLLSSLVGIVLALGSYPDVRRAPAAVLIGIILVRAAILWRTEPRELCDDALRGEIRKTFLTATIFFVVALAWQLSVYFSVSDGDSADIAMFAGLAAIGASSGLSGFPAAARIPVLVCSLPFAVLLAFASKPVEQAIGLTLIVVVMIRLRLIRLQDETFQRLVRSRFEVEAEKKRAVQAEREAHSERVRVEVLANTDALTGLTNRRGFMSVLDALPPTERREFALIIFDLDGFKPINDTFGHLAGDSILCEVSRRLRRFAPGQPFVARIGGDEFALLCRCASASEAVGVARRAVSSLAAPYSIDNRPMRISACAGVSYQRDDSVVDAVRRADIALYQAKGQMRGAVSLFTPEMEQHVQRRTSIEQALREPDLAADLELLFQPIFDIRSMELSSFEALARWQHPELGWISPSEFIPITEQISILHDISDTLLLRAAAVARDWPDRVRLSFNLSPVQLCSPATASKILQLIEQEQLAPGRLQIEVTETALLADFDVARENLSRLRDHDVRIVLDDFGSGYSSVGYLREIKFDVIKLDGSLISSATDGEAGLALLQGVLDLCRATGHECVGEHIETAEQLHILRQFGCNYGQGFGLCEPVTARQAAAIAAPATKPFAGSPGAKLNSRRFSQARAAR